MAAHLGLVRTLAHRYRDLGLPEDDLVQEGSLGLLEAIDHYNPSRGIAFDAYARFRVRRAIRNALTERSRLVRLPKHIVERQHRIARAEATLTAALGRSPTPDEIATAAELPVAAVLRARAAAAAPISLTATVVADGSPLESAVADPAAPDPELVALAREEARLVDDAVASLPARQREVVTHHYGLGRPAESVAEVAAKLHLSERRTLTIEHDALGALRRKLRAEPP